MPPIQYMLASVLLAGSSLLHGVGAAPAHEPSPSGGACTCAPPPAATIKSLYKFKQGIWLENLAPRPNGELVVGTIDVPEVFSFDPCDPSAAPYVLAAINDTTPSGPISGVSGIAPLTDRGDSFAVLGSVWNLKDNTAKSPSVYVFDAKNSSSSPSSSSSSSSHKGKHRPIAMHKAVDLAPVGLANGASPLPSADGVILIADSIKGAVWRADTRTGKLELAVQDDAMALPPAGTPVPIHLGINGVAMRRGGGGGKNGDDGKDDSYYLYWTNSARQTFARLRVNADASRAAGAEAEILARVPAGQASFDDFAFDPSGQDVYLATHPSAIVRLDVATGAETVLAHNNSVLSAGGGPTSVRFGYGPAAPLYGTGAGGQIYEVVLPKH